MKSVHLGFVLPGSPTRAVIKGADMNTGYMAAGKVQRIVRMPSGNFRVLVTLNADRRHRFGDIPATWVMLDGKESCSEIDESVYDLS